MEFIYPAHHNGYPAHHNGYPAAHYNGYPAHHNGYPAHHNENSNCVIIILIILIIIIICVLCYLYCGGNINSRILNKNTFAASARAIQDHNKSVNILKNNPNSHYSDFKNAIPDMDASKYQYITNKYKNGSLTVDDFDNS